MENKLSIYSLFLSVLIIIIYSVSEIRKFQYSTEMKEIINEKINLMKEVQNLQTKLQQQDLIILREIDSSLNIINSLSKDRQDLKLRIQERERRIEEIKNNFGTSKEINLEQLK